MQLKKEITTPVSDKEGELRKKYTKSKSPAIWHVADLLGLTGNERIVFNALIRVNCATRSELVTMCTLPRTTIYDVLVRLERRGLVSQFREKRTTRGRSTVFFHIDTKS